MKIFFSVVLAIVSCSTWMMSTVVDAATGDNLPTECSANPACVGLINDCCPTVDNVFLYCCFEEPDNVGAYQKEFTFADSALATDKNKQSEYFISTSTYFDPGTSPANFDDGNGPTNFPVISYVRDPNQVYDLIYYKTSAITNPADFVDGAKKFYIDLYSTAPPCTQVLLQLDNLALAQPDNFPIGRHSRYVTYTTKQNEWERLEFDFLDRPDESFVDGNNAAAAIDAVALFFSPGLNRADAYYFRNLDVGKKGCSGSSSSSSSCENPSTKSCSALYEGEAGACDDEIDNDNDGQMDCEDSECFYDPHCAVSINTAYLMASNQAQVEPRSISSAMNTRIAALKGNLLSACLVAIVVAMNKY